MKQRAHVPGPLVATGVMCSPPPPPLLVGPRGQ